MHLAKPLQTTLQGKDDTADHTVLFAGNAKNRRLAQWLTSNNGRALSTESGRGSASNTAACSRARCCCSWPARSVLQDVKAAESEDCEEACPQWHHHTGHDVIAEPTKYVPVAIQLKRNALFK